MPVSLTAPITETEAGSTKVVSLLGVDSWPHVFPSLICMKGLQAEHAVQGLEQNKTYIQCLVTPCRGLSPCLCPYSVMTWWSIYSPELVYVE